MSDALRMGVPDVPQVTIVVVPRESFAHALRSLHDITATAGMPFALVYVDGASPPRTRRRLRRAARDRGYTFVRAHGKITPNRMRNLGLRHVTTPYVAFVDNDVLAQPGWLAALVRAADETGADVAGPLICIGDPPFRRIHSAGGETGIDATPAGNVFREVHRFIDAPVDAHRDDLRRERVSLVEFHCMLVRRAIFARIGVLDEALTSAGEHSDFCLTVHAAGGSIVFEPAAVVNQLLPLPFMRDIASVPFFLRRWSPARNRASLAHLRAKYTLAPDDLLGYSAWLEERRRLVLGPLLRPLRYAPAFAPLRASYRAFRSRMRHEVIDHAR